jgi:hypothetical protein
MTHTADCRTRLKPYCGGVRWRDDYERYMGKTCENTATVALSSMVQSCQGICEKSVWISIFIIEVWNLFFCTMGLRVRHRELVTQTIASLLETYLILFAACFWYLYACGKFKHIYTGFFYRKFAYIKYEVPVLIKYMDFMDVVSVI